MHGNPTWGYLYRNFIPPLVEAGYRVIVPDLLGTGRSDKPGQPEVYRVRRHADRTEQLLESLDRRDATLVPHDWGMHSLYWAIRHPERLRGLFILNTMAHRRREEITLPIPIRLFRSRGTGPLLVKRLDVVRRFFLFRFGNEHRERLTPEIKRAYLTPNPTAASRIGVLVFVREIPTRPSDPPSHFWGELEDGHERHFRHKPVGIGWGMKDAAFTPAVLDELWLGTFPDAVVTRVPDAGHFVQEDAHEQVGRALLEHLRRSRPVAEGPSPGVRDPASGPVDLRSREARRRRPRRHLRQRRKAPSGTETPPTKCCVRVREGGEVLQTIELLAMEWRDSTPQPKGARAMRKIVAALFESVDGVVESPDEFTVGYMDDEVGDELGAQMAQRDTMLLGRQTYEEFAAVWPARGSDNPIGAEMNNTPKLVVSSTLESVDQWQNSTLIRGNPVEELNQLKRQPGKNILIVGSATLAQSLLRDGVVDELMLLVFPIVVGTGKRLFDRGRDRIPARSERQQGVRQRRRKAGLHADGPIGTTGRHPRSARPKPRGRRRSFVNGPWVHSTASLSTRRRSMPTVPRQHDPFRARQGRTDDDQTSAFVRE